MDEEGGLQVGHAEVEQPVVQVVPICVERGLSLQGPQCEYAEGIYQRVAQRGHSEHRQ